MEELVIEGKTYLSSKRAAKVSGYAKDYIGQLCREGRVEAKLVGRSWYVYEPSLREHQENDERKKKGVDSPAPIESREDEISSAINTTWESPSYESEIPTPLPSIEKEMISVPSVQIEPTDSGAIGEMQAAWQEWFSNRPREEEKLPKTQNIRIEREVKEIEAPEAVVRSIPKSESVAVHQIVADIAPLRTSREESHTAYVPQARVISRRKKKESSSIVGKAALIALIVFSASVVIVATGLIDSIHIGGIGESPIVQFLQGSQVIEK